MNNPKVLHIEYRLSPRRRSIGIQVTAAGQVVVTLPRGTSQANLARALEKHRAWIEAKVAERQAAWSRIKAGEAYFLGRPHRLTFHPKDGSRVTLEPGEIRVPRLKGGASVWPLLQAWYRERASGLLQERVSHFKAPMGLAPGPVELKAWKRRWGECHPDGTLKFNWRLIMLPPEIIDYVVAHELAHLTVPGHNPRFWSQVAAMVPDYAARRRWLDRQGAPFLVWQPQITPGPLAPMRPDQGEDLDKT